MKEKEQKKLTFFVSIAHFIIGAGVSFFLCCSFMFACSFFGGRLNVLSYIALFGPIAIIEMLVIIFIFLRLAQFIEVSEKGIIKRNLFFKVLAKVEWHQIVDIYYTVQSKNEKNKWIVVKENILPKSYSLLSGFSGIQFWCGVNAIKVIGKYYEKQIYFKEPTL